MTIDDKGNKVEETQAAGTAVTLHTPEHVKQLNKEVMSEFNTSKEDVYKEALRTLVQHENKLIKQVYDCQKDLKEIEKAKADLEKAFMEGKILSMEDAKQVIKTGDIDDKSKFRRNINLPG